MKSVESDHFLHSLDENQRRAVEMLRGPVCILAGAGTGKTRAITHRIAYGVMTGVYAPNRVMTLTFTHRAAAELRERLRQLGVTGVAVRTFHSAALSQLSFFWPQVVGGNVPKILPTKARLLAHVAEVLKLSVDAAVLRDLAAEIEWRKVSEMSIETYESYAERRKVSLTPEQLIAVHKAYEEVKEARRQFDFEDVLLATVGMLENEPAVAARVREQYRVFVVDEFQDVSPVQQRLLDVWLDDRRDVCVVGDANQTIYSFAGARANFLLDFPRRFNDATVVRLDQNYRSVTPIVDVANQLMAGRPGSIVLRSVHGHPVWCGHRGQREQSERSGQGERHECHPRVMSFASDAQEAEAVAERIRAEIASGMRPEDIAILYRMNAHAAVFETALSQKGVSYHVRGAKRFFELPEVRQAVMALRAASVSIIGEPLFKCVGDVLRSLGWSCEPPDVRGAVRERWESLNALAALADAAEPGITFREFTDELMERQAMHHEPTLPSVVLATLHSAKGLEWDSVYLVGVSEGRIPISYASSPKQVDEERRLLYVGITRARQRLHFSWSRGDEGRGRGLSRREPSRFLQEIGIRTEGGDDTFRV